MKPLLSAKGGDITSWRAVEEFVAAYRQAVLDAAASDRHGDVESLFVGVNAAVSATIDANRELQQQLTRAVADVGEASSSTGLKDITETFYSNLYRHFGHFHSVPVFFQYSTEFLGAVSATVVSLVKEQLGLFARHLPEMVLIAVGPAGRCEFSPFCPLQLLLVHAEVPESHQQNINLFCHALHAGFEDAGLSIDDTVTPRNPLWRGSGQEWRLRLETGVTSRSSDELIDLCRLVDLFPLYASPGYDPAFLDTARSSLKANRPALAHLVDRMAALSNGLGIMGRLKLEKIGTEKGVFRLLDHGLLPLSSAVSALALLKECTASNSCDRIRELLKRRELDVELSERMLMTWHTLHEIRLHLEKALHDAGSFGNTPHLNPDELTSDQLHALKNALESVAAMQHHVVIVFSGMGE